MTHEEFDDDALVAIANLDENEVAVQLEAVKNRMAELLPVRCMRVIEGWEAMTPTTAKSAREQLAMIEAAIAALGQSSRSLCDQEDALYRLSNHFVDRARSHKLNSRISPGAHGVARRLAGHMDWRPDAVLCDLLASLTLASMSGHCAVLFAQLDREFAVRNGRPIPPDVKLPIGSGSGGCDPELELVPVEPKDPEEGGRGKVKGGRGDSGGAAPAVVVVATVPPDSTVPGADVQDDEEDDGLEFLDLDRKA